MIIGFDHFYPANYIFAESPSFSRREVSDKPVDVSIMQDRSDSTPTSGFVKTVGPVDIKTVNYFSDGRHLNATLWLDKKFGDQLSSDIETLGYGMYIDADSDYNTGWEGVDYQLEVAMKNGTWKRNLLEFSSSGEPRFLEPERTESNFYAKNSSYVLLSLNLDTLVSPEKYKLLFYSTEKSKEDSNKKIDFTEWVNVPAPELGLSISPSFIELRSGENKTVEVKVNSTSGFEPTVHFLTNKQSEMEASFNPDTVRIPPYGMATTQLEIKVNDKALPHRQSVLIHANASYAPELITANQHSADESMFPKATKNIIKRSAMIVDIMPKLTDVQKFMEMWNTYSSPMIFVYGILAGITPLIYNIIRKRLKSNKEMNSV